MVKRSNRVYLDEEHWRLAKGAAGLKGLTLQEYLGTVVERDARNLKDQFTGELNSLDMKATPRRRGQLAIDILLMCVVIFAVGVVFIYTSRVNTLVTTPLIAQNATGTQGTQMLQAQANGYAPLWDNLGILAFGLIWVFLLVSSYYIKSNPIFFIIMVVLMIGSLLVIMMLANTFDSLNQDPNFTSYAAALPKMSWLMYHLLPVTLVVFITCGIALYAKSEGGAF